jgi:hypothetical protein
MKKPFSVLMVAVVLMVAAGVASAAEFGTQQIRHLHPTNS